jgi:hypothetical protein
MILVEAYYKNNFKSLIKNIIYVSILLYIAMFYDQVNTITFIDMKWFKLDSFRTIIDSWPFIIALPVIIILLLA